MRQLAIILVVFIGTFASSPLFSQSAFIPEAEQSTIGYTTVAEALAGLQANPKVHISVQNGWTVATDSENNTLWSFSPMGHPSYPAAVKRVVEEHNGTVFVHMDVLCQADKAACDSLVQQFQQLNERIRQHMQHGA